jgi:hypothetical protein
MVDICLRIFMITVILEYKVIILALLQSLIALRVVRGRRSLLLLLLDYSCSFRFTALCSIVKRVLSLMLFLHDCIMLLLLSISKMLIRPLILEVLRHRNLLLLLYRIRTLLLWLYLRLCNYVLSFRFLWCEHTHEHFVFVLLLTLSDKLLIIIFVVSYILVNWLREDLGMIEFIGFLFVRLLKRELGG